MDIPVTVPDSIVSLTSELMISSDRFIPFFPRISCISLNVRIGYLLLSDHRLTRMVIANAMMISTAAALDNHV